MMPRNGHSPERDVAVSFEVFPPKTEDGLARLDNSVDRLAAFEPPYFSVTYGAGGTTRDRTRGVVARIAERTARPVAHHLTCVNASRAEIEAQARELLSGGVRRLVALRGDPPGDGPFEPRPDGFSCAAELVEGVMGVGDFDVSVACHPETHPDAASPEADLDNLKRKFDAGARRAVTQYCFDTDQMLRFVDQARARGISGPIVPGIMPVFNFGRLVTFSKICGATIPVWLAEMFEGLDDDPPTRAMVAAAVAAEQCGRLVSAGFREFHVYTLNRADLGVALCRALGLRETAPARRAA